MSLARYTKLFLVAFSISFIGSLPIGTLNTSVANFALNNNFMGAFQFGAAAILVEVVLVRIALIVIDKLAHLKRLFLLLSIAACIAILLLAYRTLEAAFHMKNFADVLPFVGMNAFYSGLALSLLNPLHLPFWMGWTAVLKGRKVLISTARAYNLYIIAIGSGTCTSFIIYGVAGNYLMAALKAQHNLINWILGFTLLMTGLILAYKLITKQFLKPKAAPAE
ncbi:LysE family transporter [Mucilaginibacter gotjawali]|uniref:Threonine/homoserine/homoserine lactone efflux protein n=1 Tax=Mucilaginibacter gotjawali TaxID=1550579 RepID=A0A839S9L4_9SPHI|nr:LysE family transporter [Mucilaginibacter gotjawali]MBB3054318.1 threonine/homoserine/homoserine lactone efflux protein [Mucilaginibacter gotjawali]